MSDFDGVTGSEPRRPQIRRTVRGGGRTFSMGKVITKSLSLWTHNLGSYLVVSFILLAPSIALQGWMLFSQDLTQMVVLGVGTVVSSLSGMVLSGCLVHAAFQQLRGQPVSIWACLSVGLSRFLSILGVSLAQALLLGIPVALGAILIAVMSPDSQPLVMLLALLLGVPAMMIIVALWVAIPVTVVEQPGVVNSIQRSRELTKTHRWQLFGGMFLVGIISYGISTVINMALDIDLLETDFAIAKVFATTHGMALFTTSFWAILPAVAYHDLRTSKEGIGTEELAAVFD